VTGTNLLTVGVVVGVQVVVTWDMAGVLARAVDADEIRSERARILTGLLASVDELADRAVARMPLEIPAYAGQGAAFFADVRDQVVRHYRVKLESLLTERPIGPGGMPFVRPAAMRRARAGFALEDYLCAFRVGQQVFWEAVLDLAGESPLGHEAALSLATPVMRYGDYAATHASRVYVEFQQQQVADADRVRRDLLEHLLAGELPTRRPLLATAQAHGIVADKPVLVAIVAPAGPDADVPPLAAEALARLDRPCGRVLVVSRQSELVLVAALRAPTDAAAVCDRLAEVHARMHDDGVPLAVGVGTVAAGVAELPRAYQEATAALADVSVAGGMVALPRLSPFDYLALRADDTARRLVDPRLRAFLVEDRNRGGALVETTRAFAAADLNLKLAAERLRVHPNTAQYRLRKVAERTGRNPRRIADLVDLLVAIALVDLPDADV
jgi:hypothetical protein